MGNFNYTRVRRSFFCSDKNNEIRKDDISNQINDFLNVYGANGEEIVFYNEVMVDEGTVHITVLFKNTNTL